jgi:hypothetical protein
MDIGAVAPAVGHGSGPKAMLRRAISKMASTSWSGMADGGNCQREDFVGFADHLRHADNGARFGGILHAGTLQRFGGERQGVTIHGERHQIAGHVARGEEGRDGVTVFQRVEQARGVADILQGGEMFLPGVGFDDVARAAQVVEVEIAVAEGFD